MIVHKLFHKTHFLCLKLGIIAALLLYGLPASAGNDRWSAIGLSGNTVEVLAINPTTPDILYTGTGNGGVFKSSDGGSHWTEANTGLTGSQAYALAINPSTPDTLYVAIVSNGVFKTTDGGNNWVRANTGITNTYVRALAINPIVSDTLYAGTYGGGVFKSTNGGSN